MKLDLGLILSIGQLVAGFILSWSYLVQIAKTIRIKKVDQISLPYYALISFAVALMELYSIYNIKATPAFFVTNSMALISCSTMTYLVWYYGRKNRKKCEE